MKELSRPSFLRTLEIALLSEFFCLNLLLVFGLRLWLTWSTVVSCPQDHGFDPHCPQLFFNCWYKCRGEILEGWEKCAALLVNIPQTGAARELKPILSIENFFVPTGVGFTAWRHHTWDRHRHYSTTRFVSGLLLPSSSDNWSSRCVRISQVVSHCCLTSVLTWDLVYPTRQGSLENLLRFGRLRCVVQMIRTIDRADA